MNSGNLQSASGRLQDALGALLLAWDSTKERWHDAQSQAFEEEHVKPLCEQVSITCPAISHMAQLLGRAGRECEE